MVIIAWIIFYFFASFLPELAWGYCHNDFNTDSKYYFACTNNRLRMDCACRNVATVPIAFC